MIKIIKKVCLCGDSILKGVILENKSAHYKIDNKIGIENISEKYSLDITNASKFGCTIEKGFTAIKRSIDKGTNFDVVVLEYGGNDCNFNWSEVSETPYDEHLPVTPLNDFKKTYIDIIEYLKKKQIIPIMTNLPPISTQKFLSWISKPGYSKENIVTWLGDENAIYRYHEMYSHTIDKLAHETACPLVDIRGQFLAERKIEHLLCDDGMHPNEEGQKLIGKAFDEFISLHRSSLPPRLSVATVDITGGSI